MSISYRKEIDGLRALAVMPVIWAHAGLPGLTGGFLGVDVFFVISGFLITAILIRELSLQQFSIYAFYERRARRILPAFVLMVCTISVAIPVLDSNPAFLEDYGNSVLSSILFYSNFYFWNTSGYFGVTSELTPLLHVWSLSVEEQFYLIFPICLAFCYKLGRLAMIAIFLFVLASSLTLATWASQGYPDASFYLLPTRIWELLAGSITAIFISYPFVQNVKQIHAQVYSILGLIGVIGSYFVFTPSTTHPSIYTVPVVGGTALLLLFSTSQTLTYKLLTLRPIVYVGLISYSLYLWHQPILALLKKHYSLHLSILQIVFAVITIFLVSWISWKYIEAPFRNRVLLPRKSIFKYSVISICAVIGIGYSK